MNILIVEDEPRLADALGEIMREHHYLADVVYTGTDGLDYAQNGSYDVIVLDVMLPGMDGFEIVRRLRAGHNAVPVLMLTVRDELHDKVTGLGLAIAQSICQAHHAAIRAESGQDGTTFRVEIRKEQGEHHGN